MDESRKFVLRQTAIVAIGEAIGTGIMFGVFALLGKFDISVLLGGLVSLLVATGNFFFMAMVAVLAGDRAANQDVAGGKRLVKTSQLLRYLAMAGILVLCAITKVFNVIALVIPLVFVQPTLLITEFFRKKGA